MLEFVLSLSNYDIYPNGLAKVKFALKNSSDKVIHCLSYKFKTFWGDKTVDDFSPHEFFFNLNAGEEKEREFGEVNVSKTYLAGNVAAGEYEMEVWIRYFNCGENEIQQVSSRIKLNLIEEGK